MGGLVCRNNSAGPSVAQPGIHNSTFIPKFPVGRGREGGGKEAAGEGQRSQHCLGLLLLLRDS